MRRLSRLTKQVINVTGFAVVLFFVVSSPFYQTRFYVQVKYTFSNSELLETRLLVTRIASLVKENQFLWATFRVCSRCVLGKHGYVNLLHLYLLGGIVRDCFLNMAFTRFTTFFGDYQIIFT